MRETVKATTLTHAVPSKTSRSSAAGTKVRTALGATGECKNRSRLHRWCKTGQPEGRRLGARRSIMPVDDYAIARNNEAADTWRTPGARCSHQLLRTLR